MKSSKIKYDIGIVSLWTWKNYGTCFTYFALYKILKNMGYSVKLFERPLNSLVPPPRLAQVIDAKVGLFEKSPYQPSELQLPMETRGQMREAAEECETMMIGSDQFFNNNLNNEYGKVFHFDWVPDSRRKIVYAASWGRDEEWGTELDSKLMSYYLSRFEAFSVREKSTVDFIKKTYNRDSEFVLDPVFLCPKEEYDKLTAGYDDDLKSKPYIFSYTIDPTEEKACALRNVSEKLRMKLHVISDPHYSEEYVKSSWSIPCEMNVCEERWIALIKNASFVVTDSFHGLCLAVIYQKPFIAISNPVRGATRFESLGSLLNIKNKIINNLENLDVNDNNLFAPVDWNSISKILISEKERSLKWLSSALKIQPKADRAFCELDALKAHIEEIDKIASRNGYRISLVEEHGVNVDNRLSQDEQRIAHLEEHGVNVDNRFNSDELRIAHLEEHGVNVDNRFNSDELRIAHLESRLAKQEQKLAESYSLLINTRHRTLYGAFAWIIRKIFRNRKK